MLGAIAWAGIILARQDPAGAPSVVPLKPNITLIAQPGPPRPIPAGFLGLNVNLIRGGSWSDAPYAAAIAGLEPGHIRYPAGTIANYWDWRKGGFVAPALLPEAYQRASFEPYRLEELKRACDATGAEPVYVLNLLTSTLDDQLALLRHARELGLPVNRVELGNEYYLEHSPDYVQRFQDGGAYGTEASRWAAAIRQEFPAVRIGAVGAATRPSDPPRRQRWNAEMFRTLHGVDAIVYHVYEGSGLAQHEVERSLEGTELARSPKEKSAAQGSLAAQRFEAARLADPAGPATMLQQAWKRFDTFQEPAATPLPYEIWVTEYNLFDRSGPIWSTWAHGLFAGIMTLRFLEEPRLSLLTYHSIGGQAQFTAVFRGENDFRALKVPSGIKSVPNGYSAAGQVLRLIDHAVRPARAAARLSFTPAVDRIDGWIFRDPAGRARILILNFSAEERTVDLRTLARQADTVTLLTADPRARFVGDEPPVTTRPLGSEPLSLPPYSISLVGDAPRSAR